MILNQSKLSKLPLKINTFLNVSLKTAFLLSAIMLLNKASFCESTSIPFDISTGRPVLELTINGKGPFKFILDTGASGTIIDDSVANVLGLEVIGEVRVGSPGTDKTTSANLVSADVMLGDINFKSSHLVSMSGMRSKIHVDGVLSYQILSEYTITIDYVNNILILNAGELDKENSIPYSSSHPIIRIKINISGNEIDCDLDSGSKYGFTLPKEFASNLKLKYEPVDGETRKTMNGEITTKISQLDGNIEFGGVSFTDPEIDITEQFSNFGNIGYKILKQLKISIDQKNHLIKFDK